jgi:hypothetical protein
VLPADHAGRMRDPEPAADPFGLADGWGLGLAVFGGDDHGPTWVGHDGNGYGTACYLRAQPDEGWVVAFTSNGTSGAAMWRELRGQLDALGVPLGRTPEVSATGRRAAAPWGCAGRYANGPVEFVVAVRDQAASIAVDDEPSVPMTFHDDLVFAVPDPATGQPVTGGRFLRDPRTGRVDALQMGGRVARRTAAPAHQHSKIA